jgi:hypothetical protein
MNLNDKFILIELMKLNDKFILIYLNNQSKWIKIIIKIEVSVKWIKNI